MRKFWIPDIIEIVKNLDNESPPQKLNFLHTFYFPSVIQWYTCLRFTIFIGNINVQKAFCQILTKQSFRNGILFDTFSSRIIVLSVVGVLVIFNENS